MRYNGFFTLAHFSIDSCYSFVFSVRNLLLTHAFLHRWWARKARWADLPTWSILTDWCPRFSAARSSPSLASASASSVHVLWVSDWQGMYCYRLFVSISLFCKLFARLTTVLFVFFLFLFHRAPAAPPVSGAAASVRHGPSTSQRDPRAALQTLSVSVSWLASLYFVRFAPCCLFYFLCSAVLLFVCLAFTLSFFIVFIFNRDKWINYIDLSKRNDFNPSTSFYFWYLDLPLLKTTIRDHVYQSMLNLTLRY